MRVSKEKAAANRQDMLTAAARLFREQGVSATGVDAKHEIVVAVVSDKPAGADHAAGRVES